MATGWGPLRPGAISPHQKSRRPAPARPLRPANGPSRVPATKRDEEITNYRRRGGQGRLQGLRGASPGGVRASALLGSDGQRERAGAHLAQRRCSERLSLRPSRLCSRRPQVGAWAGPPGPGGDLEHNRQRVSKPLGLAERRPARQQTACAAAMLAAAVWEVARWAAEARAVERGSEGGGNEPVAVIAAQCGRRGPFWLGGL